jgi:hypothetical protein
MFNLNLSIFKLRFIFVFLAVTLALLFFFYTSSGLKKQLQGVIIAKFFKIDTLFHSNIAVDIEKSAHQRIVASDISQLDNIAKNLSQLVTSDQQNSTIVHYAWFYGTRTPGPSSQLTFLQCMSVLSVLVNFRPHAILVHSDRPEFWPFQSCHSIIGNWSTVHMVHSSLKGNINGRKIGYIEHEADIKKLEVVAEQGGMALDFDVFIIDGARIRQLLQTWPCILCLEVDERMNNGFLACNKGAAYPNLILDQSYYNDYRSAIDCIHSLA